MSMHTNTTTYFRGPGISLLSTARVSASHFSQTALACRLLELVDKATPAMSSVISSSLSIQNPTLTGVRARVGCGPCRRKLKLSNIVDDHLWIDCNFEFFKGGVQGFKRKHNDVVGP